MNILNPIRRTFLRAELPAAALSLGWDFGDEWVKALSREMSCWDVSDTSAARSCMHDRLDVRRYVNLFGRRREITVQYKLAYPTPLAILQHQLFSWVWGAGDVTLTVGAFNATLRRYGTDLVIAEFVGCGRMLQEGTYTAIEDTVRLIAELTGYQYSYDDVHDRTSAYEELRFHRIDGEWMCAASASTRSTHQ